MLGQRKPVSLSDRDVKELHVKGSGPGSLVIHTLLPQLQIRLGGQAVNKTSNAVCLLHTPTGIQVRSHKTRYLEVNRRDAWKLLESRLDDLINGPASKNAIEALRERERKRTAGRRSRRKHQVDDSDLPISSINEPNAV